MTVVVGYVRSPEGSAALAAAIEAAQRGGDQVIVVHAFRAGTDATVTLPSVEQDLDAVNGLLDESGVKGEVRELPADLSPAEGLIDVVNELDARLLVIGLRRRSPVGKLILGSTAQRVLLDAPCPVLAVKA
jgi:nucleotide-binding universal stress UspA family protein